MKLCYAKPECKIILFEETCILTSSSDKNDGVKEDFVWEGLSFYED